MLHAAPGRLCLLLACVSFAACLPPVAEQATRSSPARAYLDDAAALKRGRGIFVGTCAGYCHSLGDRATSDAPNLFDCDWRHGGSDQQIFAAIYDGVPGTRMLGFGGKLDDADLWKLVAFLRTASRCDSAE